ncbi:hypothetical protein SAMN04488053_1109 [Alkalicoccus daliensis]|uniref:Uncharacterized protein n=1 Tax=Alkalicoccus daliensis TaxID=745820 RepID=A0A1H0I626_9BACI|nr:hypothetical protein SAMN04488053_1109 [Alkalicoccus daliensis]
MQAAISNLISEKISLILSKGLKLVK